MVVARIDAGQAQAREGVGDAAADIATAKGAQAIDRHHIVRLQRRQTQRHTRHAGGAVIHLGDAGGRRSEPFGDHLVRTHHRHGVAEIGTVLRDQPRHPQLVAAYLELARCAKVARHSLRRHRQARRTRCAVVDADQVAAVDAHARARYTARAQGVDRAGGLVLDAGQGIGRGRAIGVADGRDPHQQLVRWHDGVVACGVTDGVVRRVQPTGLQGAGVLIGQHIGGRIRAADAGRAGEHGRSLAIDKSAEAHPRKIGSIRLRQEPRVVGGPYAQRGLGNGAAAVGPAQRVVACVRSSQCHAAHIDSARACVFVAVDGRAGQR